MKKLGIFLMAIAFIFSSEINAQSFDIGMLDNAMGLLDKGDHSESGKVLGTAMGLLTKSTQSMDGDFASKIAAQAGSLTKLLPALQSGNANISGIQKIIQTIKMLYGAMNLNQMIKGGDLAGKGASLLSNVELLKGGLSVLEGGKSVNKIMKSLDKVVQKAPNLDMEGRAGKVANKVVAKKLQSSLGLLGKLI